MYRQGIIAGFVCLALGFIVLPYLMIADVKGFQLLGFSQPHSILMWGVPLGGILAVLAVLRLENPAVSIVAAVLLTAGGIGHIVLYATLREPGETNDSGFGVLAAILTQPGIGFWITIAGLVVMLLSCWAYVATEMRFVAERE